MARRLPPKENPRSRVKVIPKAGNPTAGPAAIPAKWTLATVSRKGGQIQIRIGGKRS